MLKKVLVNIVFLTLVLSGVAQATPVQLGTASKQYRTGGHNLVRTATGVLYAVVLNITENRIEAWKYSGGSWSKVGTSFAPYGSGSIISCAIDSTGLIHVVYYSDSTHLAYNTFNTSTDTWGTGANIYTVMAGGSYHCDIALDSADVPHVVFQNFISSLNLPYYGNKVGGSWNTAVLVEGVNSSLPNIAIDTTSGGNHRTDIPQIAYYKTAIGKILAALGDQNNAASFTLVNPANQGCTIGMGVQVLIDSNGSTTIVSYYGSAGKHMHTAYIDGNGTWGTAGNWTVSENIGNDSSTFTGASSVIDGTDRYTFIFYSSAIALYYVKSVNYGNWSAQTLLESPAAAYKVMARWQYANNPSYTTYGIDYLFTAGSTTNNLYWNNLPLLLTIVGDIEAALAQTYVTLAGAEGIAGTIAAGFSQVTSSLSAAVDGITAVAGSTLSQATAALSGPHGVTGAVAGALTQITAALSGSEIKAAIGAALSQVTASISGAVDGITALTGSTLAQITASLTGPHGVTGAVAGALSQVVGTLSGSSISGALSAALSQITTSLSGAVDGITAIAGSALTQITAGLTGSHGVAGTISSTLSQVTAALSGSSISGALAALLAPATAALNGAQGVGAALTASLAQVTANLMGDLQTLQQITAALAASLQQTVASLAAASVAGVLNATESAIQAAFNSAQGVAGSLAATLPQLISSLSGAHGISGSMVSTLENLSAAISGSSVAAYIGATLSPVAASLAGTFTRLIDAILNGATAAVEADIRSGHGIGASISAGIGRITTYFSGGHGIGARLQGILEAVKIELAALELRLWGHSLLVPAENRIWAAGAEDRNITLPAENRMLTVGAP